MDSVQVAFTQALQELGAGVEVPFDDLHFPMALTDTDGIIRWQNRESIDLVGDRRGSQNRESEFRAGGRHRITAPIVRALRFCAARNRRDERRRTLKWGRGYARPRPGRLLMSGRVLTPAATTRRTIVPDAASGE